MESILYLMSTGPCCLQRASLMQCALDQQWELACIDGGCWLKLGSILSQHTPFHFNLDLDTSKSTKMPSQAFCKDMKRHDNCVQRTARQGKERHSECIKRIFKAERGWCMLWLSVRHQITLPGDFQEKRKKEMKQEFNQIVNKELNPVFVNVSKLWDQP